MHKPNYDLIRPIPADQLAWSLFCASNMPPRTETISYQPEAGAGAANLVAKADSPPAWSNSLLWLPLLGTHLNIMAQAYGYYAPLEDCVDFIAKDLTAGLDSEFVGKRVGVKVNSKKT